MLASMPADSQQKECQKERKWNERPRVGQELTATGVDVDCHHCSSANCLCLLRKTWEVSILGPGWHLLSALRPKIAASPTFEDVNKELNELNSVLGILWHWQEPGTSHENNGHTKQLTIKNG